MKTLILAASVGFTLMPNIAAADELARPNWNGFYIGLSLGGAAGTHDTRFLDSIGLLPANSGIFDEQSGLVAGGHVGFNRQFGGWTLGLEANLMGTTIEGSGSRDSDLSPGWTVHTDVDVNWLVTGVARVGYAWGNALFFAKGGVAVMQFEMDGYSTNLGVRVGGDRSSDFSVGWTAGAGVEWKMTDKWSVRFDYDYIDFRLDSREDGGAAVEIGAHLHVGRIGVNYALDWGK